MPPKKTKAADEGQKSKPGRKMKIIVPAPPKASTTLEDLIDPELKDDALKYIKNNTEGWFFAENNMKTGGHLEGVANPRPLSTDGTIKLVHSMNQGADRENNPIVYICTIDNIPRGLAKDASELVYSPKNPGRFLVKFPNGKKVWRIAGNHRVAANALVAKRLEAEVKIFSDQRDALDKENPKWAILDEKIVKLKERAREATNWPAKLLVLPLYWDLEKKQFISKVARVALKTVTVNLPRYEWLGSAAEIVNTCGDTIRQTTTENDAIAYANVYLEQALGDQFEVLKDCILDVQYNVQGRDFLTAASQVPLLTKASYSNDVLGRYWSTTAGCGWAYLMLHASLQPRIALQKYDESLETNEKAVQVIDIALNKAWDEISESLAPGSWNIIPGDSTADQFFGRLQHELTEGLKYFPEAAKEYPELHLKLVALGPAAKKVICGCFPSNIFFPVYCSHLIESLQNFFLKIPHCFRLLELITDAGAMFRGSVSNAQRHKRNSDPSVSFIREFLNFNEATAAVVKTKPYLAAPFLFTYMINTVAPQQDLIRHRFRLFFSHASQPVNPLTLVRTLVTDDTKKTTAHSGPAAEFYSIVSRNIWRPSQSNKNSKPAATLKELKKLDPITSNFFTAYHNHYTWEAELKEVTSAARDAVYSHNMYSFLYIMQDRFLPILLKCMKSNKPFLRFVKTLLQLPALVAKGAVPSSPTTYALPLTVGIYSLDDLTQKLGAFQLDDDAVSDIERERWAVEDAIHLAAGHVKGRKKVDRGPPAGWEFCEAMIKGIHTAFLKNVGVLGQAAREEALAEVNQVTTHLVEIMQVDIWNSHNLIPPEPPVKMKPLIEKVTVLNIKAPEDWDRLGTKFRSKGSGDDISHHNPFFGKSGEDDSIEVEAPTRRKKKTKAEVKKTFEPGSESEVEPEEYHPRHARSSRQRVVSDDERQPKRARGSPSEPSEQEDSDDKEEEGNEDQNQYTEKLKAKSKVVRSDSDGESQSGGGGRAPGSQSDGDLGDGDGGAHDSQASVSAANAPESVCGSAGEMDIDRPQNQRRHAQISGLRIKSDSSEEQARDPKATKPKPKAKEADSMPEKPRSERARAISSQAAGAEPSTLSKKRHASPIDERKAIKRGKASEPVYNEDEEGESDDYMDPTACGFGKPKASHHRKP